MKTGKDIDSIYRERFHGASMPPPQDSWENIVSQLSQKEENKKAFPVWWKMAGVAAVLALLLTIFDNSPTPSTAEDFTTSASFGKIRLEIPEISGDFNRIMEESEMLLQALILHQADRKFQEQSSNMALGIGQNSLKTKFISEVEKSSFHNLVFREENLNQEEAEENLLVDLSSLNEIASDNDLLENNEPVELAYENEHVAGKFTLSTRVAPVYFNSFGKGNAVDSNFSQKGAAGGATLSFGINMTYHISDKINIRSGIHKVDLAYNTREVSFNEVAATTSYGKNTMKTTTLASPSGGSLDQKMGFFEIPLEVEYVIIDNALTVGVIGGGSALLLEESQVSFSAMGNSTNLGETNNLNEISFTTNFGVSLGVEIYKNLELKMEPMVKLQLNTFKNSEKSSPYFFGIYSGVNYRF